MDINCDNPENFKNLVTKEQTILLNWISNNLNPIESFNKKHNSYGLKHLFEHSTNGFYINNGTFKGAMLKAGYKCKNDDYKNWNFNISEKSSCFK